MRLVVGFVFGCCLLFFVLCVFVGVGGGGCLYILFICFVYTVSRLRVCRSNLVVVGCFFVLCANGFWGGWCCRYVL